MVLLQRAWAVTRQAAEGDRDEHEQAEQAVQPGHGPAGTHRARQDSLGEGPRQAHLRGGCGRARACVCGNVANIMEIKMLVK